MGGVPEERALKYSVDYQYQPNGAARPLDTGPAIDMEGPENLIPNVGDFVSLHLPDEHNQFSGKVKSRLFRYIQPVEGQEIFCHVNIVVAESDDDWGQLIKE
jgi:hypothetical protein